MFPKGRPNARIARLDRIRWSKGKTGAGAIRLAMQRTMQRHCAVFRDGPLLDEGLGKLDGVIETMRADLGVADRSMVFNTDLAEALELDNMLGPGKCQPSFGDRPNRKPRRSCAGGFSEAGRRKLAQAQLLLAR